MTQINPLAYNAEEKARELEPCPFCGNDGDALSPMVDVRQRLERPNLYQAHIECAICGARGPQTALYDSEKHALAKLAKMHDDEGWNDRVQPAPLAGDEISEEALEQTCQHFGYSTKSPPGAVIGFARKAIEIALTSLNRREG